MSKCEQCNWKLIDEKPLVGWFGNSPGTLKLFQCGVCGRLLKMVFNRNDY